MSDTSMVATPEMQIALETGDARPNKEPMTDEEFAGNFHTAVSKAENWNGREYSGDRTKAYRYYNGECDYPAQPGRSQFVMRVTRDTIEQMHPKIMKNFVSGTEIVAFQANSTDEQSQIWAEEATDAFHHVYWNLNPGYRNTQTLIRDALKAKTGTFHAFNMDEVRVIGEEEFTGTQDAYAALLQNPDVEVIYEEFWSQDGLAQGVFGAYPTSIPMVTARVRLKTRKARLVIDTVAPEDFIIDENATGLGWDEFTLVGKRVTKTVSYAVDLGVPFDIAVQYAGNNYSTDGLYRSTERRERRDAATNFNSNPTNDAATRPLVFYSCFMRVDKDGDGHAELRHILAIGTNAKYVISDEIVPEHEFASTPAIPIEHNVIGQSVADQTIDLQDVQTQLRRGQLNNANQVQNPRPIVVDGQYDPDSLADTNFGAEIIQTQQGAVQWLQYPFEGDKLEMISQSFDGVRGERTGISRDNQALDAANLKDSPVLGVLAVIGSGNTQPDTISATIAHYAFVPLAKIVIRLLKENATDEGLMIRTRSGMRLVDPRQWPDDMWCDVKVGLGTGSREENIASLIQTQAKQTQALSMLGANNNPLTSIDKWAEAEHEILRLGGINASTRYWNDPERVRQWEELQRRQAAATPPEPSEEDKDRAHEQALQAQKDQTALQKQAMGDETDVLIQSMKDQTKLTEVATEAALTVQTGEEADLG